MQRNALLALPAPNHGRISILCMRGKRPSHALKVRACMVCMCAHALQGLRVCQGDILACRS